MPCPNRLQRYRPIRTPNRARLVHRGTVYQVGKLDLEWNAIGCTNVHGPLIPLFNFPCPILLDHPVYHGEMEVRMGRPGTRDDPAPAGRRRRV